MATAAPSALGPRTKGMRLALPSVPAGTRIVAPQAGPQTQFLACTAQVVVYGGAAGGGKTWGLLLDASRYAALQPVKGFGAVIFRRTAPQIKAQGGLWDESGKLYPIMGGKPNKTDFAWEWPQHGTRVRFAHMQYDEDMYNWQGSQIPYIGFDELTHFGETAFFYMLSRNRSACGVRPRVRATVNPDADSWVKRFLAPWVDREYPWHAEPGQVLRFYRENDVTYWLRDDEEPPEHVLADQLKTGTYIPARLADNPALLETNPEYYANLMALPYVERVRLLGGDNAWEIRASGNKFKREWFKLVEPDAIPRADEFRSLVRRWDFAATEPKKQSDDPDWTAGVLMGRTNDERFYVLDVVHVRVSPKGVDDILRQTAALDRQRFGRRVRISGEQEPGSSGKMVAERYRRLLVGYDVRFVRASGDKELRANPFSAQCEGGNVYVVNDPTWTQAYLNELCAFPMVGVHDDMVDGSSGAFDDLAGKVGAHEHVERRQQLREAAATAAATAPLPDNDDDWF